MVLNAFRHQRSTHFQLVTSPHHIDKCSTPFGINEVRTRGRACNAGDGRVLNAFRHQRSTHRRFFNDCKRPVPVLNAFRHQRSTHSEFAVIIAIVRCAQRLSASTKYALVSSTGVRWSSACAQRLSASTKYAREQQRGAVVGSPCSTPFGINEVRTSPASLRNDAELRAQRLSASTKYALSHRRHARNAASVLNAFRHQRSTHSHRRACMAAAISAQRLSASTKYAHSDITLNATPRRPCSTPFGINEVRTSQQHRSHVCRPGAQRLSASTKYALQGIRCSSTRQASAQRLSASTKYALCLPPFSRQHVLWCSTPFGINEVRTCDGGRYADNFRHVLNAFRHQRSTHQVIRFERHRRYPVLNAFRHQRSTHAIALPPFARSPVVLNAFRHQRSTHGEGVPERVPEVACSTPFGINEVRTPSWMMSPGCSSCAQRLSASTKYARVVAGYWPVYGAVLNAFRHQRSTHFFK